MAERISASHVPGFLTFADGRVPDGHNVPQPPRAAPPDHRLRRTVLACAVVILLAPFAAALLR